MSTSSLLEAPPSGERLEPVGTENPAYFSDTKAVLANGHVSQGNSNEAETEQKTYNLLQRQALGKGIDVHYNSGMTTIRIAGTPVLKRKEFFENKGGNQKSVEEDEKAGVKLKDNVPNSIKNSMIRSNSEQHPSAGTAEQEQDVNFAISTNIPVDPKIKPETDLNCNDVTQNYNGPQQKYKQTQENNPKRKKVSFHDAVVINSDEITTLSDNKNSTQKYTEEVEVSYTNGSVTDLTSQSRDTVLTNGSVTPIVDELELRQLSQKLSSKEKQGPFLPAPPDINSSTILNGTNNNKTPEHMLLGNSQANKDVIYVRNNSSDGKAGSKKDKKKEGYRRVGQRCVWLAVSLLVLAIAGLLVLGVLYAIRFSAESKTEILRVLTSKLTVRTVQSSDLFTTGWVDTTQSPGNFLYVIESGSVMTWVKPLNTTLIAWHRGSTLKIVSLPTSPGGALTTQLLGDVVKETDVMYSLTMSTDRWYAAEVKDRDQYCVITVVDTGNPVSWSVPETSSLEALHPTHRDNIAKYTRQ